MAIKRSAHRSVVNWIWLICFTQMYLFANIIKFNHYIATLLLVGASAMCCDWKFRVSRKQIAIFAYACIFAAWITLSAFWSSGLNSDRKAIIVAVIENLIMGFCLLSYVKDSDDLLRMIRIFIYSTSIMCVVFYASSPIASWGTTHMGTKLAIWRNDAGYYFAYASFLALYQYFALRIKKKRLVIFGILLAFGAVGTGSRKVIVHLAALFMLAYVLKYGRKKTLKRICGIGLFGIAALVIAYRVPIIREKVFEKLFSMLGGINSQNASTATRAYMIQYGLELWKNNPIIGAGVDEYRIWIASKTTFLKSYAMEPTYSHCNYVELLANNGVIGVVLYYAFPIYVTWKNRKKYDDPIAQIGLIMMAVFLFLDFGAISYFMRFYQLILMISIMALVIKKENRLSSNAESGVC